MKLRRTANAGVLLELDGVSILLDGVCREVKPYPATPPEEKALLTEQFPDIVAFTHLHKDHYDPVYAAEYVRQTNGVVLGPEGLPGVCSTMEPVQLGGVMVTPVSSRHIGAAGKDTPHASFIIRGSRCVWFLGDASPSQWKGRTDLPAPDILIVPYAYANTAGSWAFTKSLQATVIILHMPKREDDILSLWDSVLNTVERDDNLYIPDISEEVYI